MSFNVLDYLDRLTPAKGKNRYHCPVCGNDNFTIDPKVTPAKYQCWSGCSCKEVRDMIAPLPEKSPQPKQERTFDYYDRAGVAAIQVVRRDDGDGNKQIFQNYWHCGVWKSASKVPEAVKQQAKKSVLPYRYNEAVKHDRIFWVEGEQCAELLWSLGVPAVTTIGGCDGLNRYGEYSGLFEGKEIVICPDQDVPGLKYAEQIAKLYLHAKWVYAFPTDCRWEKPPAKGGLDVADWIAQGATKEDILGAIGDRRITQSKAARNQKVVPIRDSGISASDLPDRIRDLLNQNLEAAELAAAKIQLRQQSLVSEREFDRLLETVENSLDQATDPTADIDLLLSAQQSKLAIDQVLPVEIAQPLTQYANWQNIKPEVCLMSMLAVAGTLAENGTKVVLQRSIDFEVTPNIYVAIEAEPSQKKSPILKTIARKPLAPLAKEAKAQYEFELEQWRRQKKEAENNKEEFNLPEPALRVYQYSKATGEAILRQADRVPKQGLLCLSDELEGYFKGANQYRSGKGSDSEDLLTFYDGHGGGATLRVDGVRSDVQDFNFGMLGPIQPKVLQKRLGDCEDSNGSWARWFIVRQPTVASTLPDEDEGFDIVGLLSGLYQKINQLPAKEYRLDREAFKLFQGYYNRLEVQRVEEPNSALRAVYGKTAGRIGKLALNLHLIEAVVAGIAPADLISAATIRKAAVIAKYAIDQIRAIYADFSGDEIFGSLAKVVELSRRKGEVKARDVQQGFTKSVRPDSATVRRWFIQLADQGYGEIFGEGRGLSFTAYAERRVEAESEPDREFPDFDIETTEEIKSELSELLMEDDQQVIDQFVVEYQRAANQNGRSIQELKRVTEKLQRIPEFKQRVWEVLPIDIKKRVQVEVLGKPLNHRDREVS